MAVAAGGLSLAALSVAALSLAALSLAGTHVVMVLIGGCERHGTDIASLAEIKLHERGCKGFKMLAAHNHSTGFRKHEME